MAGKHKRPDIFGGRTPRGPERWARAAANALQRPNSKAARLFYGRVAIAHAVAEECRREQDPKPTQAWQHMGVKYRPNPYFGHLSGEPRYIPTAKRGYATCSVFCAVMQIQLDFPEGSVSDVSAAFSARVPGTDILRVQQLDPKTLTRKMRCQFCGGSVK